MNDMYFLDEHFGDFDPWMGDSSVHEPQELIGDASFEVPPAAAMAEDIGVLPFGLQGNRYVRHVNVQIFTAGSLVGPGEPTSVYVSTVPFSDVQVRGDAPNFPTPVDPGYSAIETEKNELFASLLYLFS